MGIGVLVLLWLIGKPLGASFFFIAAVVIVFLIVLIAYLVVRLHDEPLLEKIKKCLWSGAFSFFMLQTADLFAARSGPSVDNFADWNLFDDGKLAELVNQARNVVSGLSTKELRQDGNLRVYFADEMNQLRVAVDGTVEDLPRRKIRMAA